MNIQISELSEIALSVSNTLKSINLNTLFVDRGFWGVYNNFNLLEVKKHRDIKKPFGVQAVLESFAKSVGFKSYNGLLNSGLTSIQIGNDALNHLNPNPLNPYHTNIWECLCFEIMEAGLSNKLLPIKTIQNFKKNHYIDLLPYAGKGIFNLVTVRSEFSTIDDEDYNYVVPNNIEKHIPYYSVVSCMYCMAIEKLIDLKEYSNWFKAQHIDFKAFEELYAFRDVNDWIEIRIPVKEMLIKDQWESGSYTGILQDITLALAELFSIVVKFEGEGKSPIDKIAVFKVKHKEIYQMMIAKQKKQNHELLKQSCDVILNEVDGDQGFYCCDLVEKKQFNPIGLKMLSKYINYDYMGVYFKAVNGEKHFAKKAFWVNACCNYIDLKKNLDIQKCLLLIRSFLNNHLKPVVVSSEKECNFSDDLPYQQTYVLSTTNFKLSTLIPKYISLDSEYPLKHYVGEVFIQNILMNYNLKNEVSLDLDSKSIGHPDTLVISETEKIKIRKTLSNVDKGSGYMFCGLNMVEEISLYLDDSLEKRVGLSKRRNPDKKLYCETESEIYFAMSLTFADMLYKCAVVDIGLNVQTEITMLATLNKHTKKISVKYEVLNGEYYSNPLFGYEECPNSQLICDFLISMSDIHELIYEYFMMFYNGKYKDILDTVDKQYTTVFSINPISITWDAYDGLDDILDIELNIM